MKVHLYNMVDTILDWVAYSAYLIIFADEGLGFYDD